MHHEQLAGASLSLRVASRSRGLLHLVSLLKRIPTVLRWKIIRAFGLLSRESTGLVHRLQRKRIVHFLHIGKTGGTAIASVISRYLKSSDYEIVIHEHNIKLTDIPRGEKVVFFVRDPVSRFVSGFYSRKRQGRPRHDVPWSSGEEAAFARFSTPNELALALSSSDEVLRSAAVDAIQNIIHLNEPHWTWFKNERYFLSRNSDFLFIGFQESLSEDFAMLKQILNLPEEARLPDDAVASHKNPDHVDKRLDDEAMHNLRVWYAEDYRFLGRCREVAVRIRHDWERH